MSDTVIQVDNLWKKYRLGVLGTGTLRHDFNRWCHRALGKPDPYSKVGEEKKAEIKKAESGNQKSDLSDLADDEMWALRGVSFEVKRGEILGIIGRNGAGKSTLLKILSRVTAPTGGEVRVKGRIASLLEVGTGFHPELTGRENIFLNGAILGMTKSEIKTKFDEIVAFAEVEKFLDTPVKRYSSGMYVRLAFAVAAHLEPEILIVDEVLAVGDAEFQKKCLGKMESIAHGQGRTILFVSHNVDALQRICETGILLCNGTVISRESIFTAIDRYRSDKNLKTSATLRDHYGIVHVQISQDDLRCGRLRLYVAFNYPSMIRNPTLGVVVYNEQNNPIFGTNSLFDPPICHLSPCCSGSATVVIDPLPLWSGSYRVSLWLSDGASQLDHSENIVGFDYVSANVPPTVPPPVVIGATRVAAKWQLSHSGTFYA